MAHCVQTSEQSIHQGRKSFQKVNNNKNLQNYVSTDMDRTGKRVKTGPRREGTASDPGSSQTLSESPKAARKGHSSYSAGASSSAQPSSAPFEASTRHSDYSTRSLPRSVRGAPAHMKAAIRKRQNSEVSIRICSFAIPT